MSDAELKNEIEPVNDTPARGRPRGSGKPKPEKAKRRNFAAELESLQARVDMALKMLHRGTKDANNINTDMIEMAVELLSETTN